MRVVLDTNILVRAAADDQGLAGGLLRELTTGLHTPIVSPYLLSEVSGVLAYPRLPMQWRMSERRVEAFVSRLPHRTGSCLPIRTMIQLFQPPSPPERTFCVPAIATCWMRPSTGPRPSGADPHFVPAAQNINA
jgi:hypothetical protein